MRLFATPPDMSRRDRSLMWLLGAAFFIGQYDMTLISIALPERRRRSPAGRVARAVRSGGNRRAVRGLVTEGVLFNLFGSHSSALSVLALSTLLALPFALFLLRETANTRLE